MEKPISTERSRPHQMSQSAMGSPTQYKSFAATVRSAIRSPSREWTNTIKAVTSPTLKKDSSSSTVSKTNEKDPQKSVTKKDYGFKEQVEIVKKTLPLEQIKATADSYASPRPSKTTTQDNTPDNKSSTSKGSTPKLARLGSNTPYMLYQFVTEQAMSQSVPNPNDKVASLTKEVEDSVKVIAEKEKEIEQLRFSIKENLEKIQRQDKDLAQIKETSSNVERSLKETCDKLNIKIVQCEQEITDLKLKIEKLNEEHKKILEQMRGDEAVKVSQWKDKAGELEKRVKLLEGEILMSGEDAKGLQEKEKEVLHLKGQLDAQEKDMKRVKEDNLKLEEQLKRFDSQLGDMIRKSEDKLKLEISQLKGIIKSLEEEIKHYKDLNAKLERPAREPDVSKEVLEEKEVKIQSLESEIKCLVSEKESSIKNSQQINEALVLINNFSRNLQIPQQLELIPAIQLLLEELAKSQQCSKEKISAENESQNEMITMQEHNAIKSDFENKIKLLQSEKHELSEKLEEAEALASLVKIQQQHQLLISNTNLVSESREVSLCPEEEYKEEQEVTVTEYASEAGEEKLNSSRPLTKKKVTNSKTKLGKEDLTLSVKKKSSTKASKLDSHKEVKKMREDDPIYKQLEKMIKDLTERVVTSDKKAKKAYEEKLVEVSNAQLAKEQKLLEEMEKLKEEKKELLKKLDDMQWDKAYEYMRKTKAEKQVEVKAVEQASKPKKTVIETGKNKKKK